MGIPLKGSRPLELTGVKYRSMIRKGKPRRDVQVAFCVRQHVLSGCRVVTVQRMGSGDKPEGQLLQVKLYSKTWIGIHPDEDLVEDTTVTPADVKKLVALSIVQGWNPCAKGTFTPKNIDLPEWETI